MDGELVQNTWWMKNWFRTSWWMKKWFRTAWWMKQIVKNFVMDAKNWSEDCDRSIQPSTLKSLEEFIDENEPWLLIGIPSKDVFLRIYSAWNNILWDLIWTWRTVCHSVEVFMRRCNVTCDSTSLSVTGCMNIQEDIHRGENLRGWNSWQARYADGMFRRCDQNRVNTCGQQRLVFSTIGESK